MGKNISRPRAARIAAVAKSILEQLSTLFEGSPFSFVFKFYQSKRTGSVYLKVRIYTPTGRRLKDREVQVRVSDHSPRDARRANFSRPVQRFYGVWAFGKAYRIRSKVNRIGTALLRRCAWEGGEA